MIRPNVYRITASTATHDTAQDVLFIAVLSTWFILAALFCFTLTP